MSDPTQLRERAHSAAIAVGLYASTQTERRRVADAVLAEVAAEVEARRDADIASGNDCHALNQPIRSADFISRADALSDLLSVVRPSEGSGE